MCQRSLASATIVACPVNQDVLAIKTVDSGFVMQLVATGMLNKQVGGELGMAEKNVETHRAHIMQKLGITSVAELMVVLQKAEVPLVVRPGTKV